MAHNIDMTNDRANIAFLGSRNDVWHRLGHEMKVGMSIDDWAKASGLTWDAVKVPALVALEGAAFDHIESGSRMLPMPERKFVVRSDNGHALGYVSDRYQPVQPRDVLEWFDRYIAVDDRFQLDVAGSLRHGEIIWATATFKDPLSVAGDRHTARLLMTTTFDGSGSTINKGTMTRTVCNNTLDVALAEKSATVRTRHSTKFDSKSVSNELAKIASGFASYKAMGDAMAQVEIAKEEVSKLFKTVLDIPFDMKKEDISSRKLNQFQELSAALSVTNRETQAGTCWAALNAITRYVDHEKSVKGNGVSADEKRFTSAQFGSGAAMKEKAVAFLMPRVKDLIAA